MWKAIFVLGCCLLCIYATTIIPPGGFYDVNTDDEDVVQAANEATRELSKLFKSKYHHKLFKVSKAQEQVVAGMNYKMDIVLGKTNCKKSEVESDNVADCEFQDGISTYKICSVLVYKDLDDKHKLTRGNCNLISKKDI